MQLKSFSQLRNFMSFCCNIYTEKPRIIHDCFFFSLDIFRKESRKYFSVVFIAQGLGEFMDDRISRIMAFDEKNVYSLKHMLSDNECVMVIGRNHHHFKGPIGSKGYGLTLDQYIDILSFIINSGQELSSIPDNTLLILFLKNNSRVKRIHTLSQEILLIKKLEQINFYFSKSAQQYFFNYSEYQQILDFPLCYLQFLMFKSGEMIKFQHEFLITNLTLLQLTHLNLLYLQEEKQKGIQKSTTVKQNNKKQMIHAMRIGFYSTIELVILLQKGQWSQVSAWELLDLS